MTLISMNRPDAQKIEDEAEAVMRAEYILALRKVRDELRELRDHEFLFTNSVAVKNVQQIHDHLSGAISSIAKAVSWITRPKI